MQKQGQKDDREGAWMHLVKQVQKKLATYLVFWFFL